MKIPSTKSGYKLRLTLKQRRLQKILSENKGLSMRKAMIEAGYSKHYADTPAFLTSTERWKYLLEKDLPDDLLTKTANKGLKATMIKSSPTEPDKVVPDWSVRQRFLETALKMKGKLGDRIDITSNGEKITGFTFIAPSVSEGEIVDDE